MVKEVSKSDLILLEEELNRKTKTKLVAMLAPCFIAHYEYPYIISELRDLGFDKVVELTFGAKLVNHEYHKLIKEQKDKKNNENKLLISTVCPGTVQTIKTQFPQYEKNLLRVYSPMIATAKISKNKFPKHKTVFISPCNFKKIEAKKTKDVDYVISMPELDILFQKYKIKKRKIKLRPQFDRFYNEYTRIYPVAGGLAKTAHIKGILNEGEYTSIDGIQKLTEFLKNPDKNIVFLDGNFCIGGCIGGPYVNPNLSVGEKTKKVLNYVKLSKKEHIPKGKMGTIKQAKIFNIKISY